MTQNIYILLLAITISFSSFGQRKEKKLIRQSFENYKSAILNDRGEEAVKYVDSRTIKYYSDILETTINADSLGVNALGLLDKMMVLAMRHRTSKEDILSFDGKGLLVYAIKEGMVGKSSVAHNSIGDVEVDGDFAKGQFVSYGEKAPFYFHFYKEEGQWKVDLTSIFSVGTMAFKKMLEDSGEEENEYLLKILEMTTGKKVDADIWEPVK